MIITCTDFETTGIPTETDKHAIVEIGRCELTVWEAGKTFVDAPYTVLCNPGRPMPHEAMAVHHITDAMVADATGDVSFIAESDYFAAHKADYELSFYQPKVPVICTYKVALRLWPDAASHSLQFLRYFLDLKANEMMAMPPHRAGPDAYLCALLMERIVKEQRVSLDDMVRWSAGPALLPRVNFGKHKGAKWEDLPTDYLKWIVDKSDMDRDVKANARHHLAKRRSAA